MNRLIEYLIQSKYLTLDNFEINKNFYIFPRAFVDIEYYKEMSIDAKYLYAILYNRAQISRETGWVDENQRIYFSAPGMGNILTVKVRYRLGSRNC
ncbi:hypothetical protein DLS39_13310 [Staphylococcus pseudintermedius]|uniref:replication initiator protein A n=1 Tax=Staphylococcus pseudintermedius TaxID=283734 RepID=UPI00101F383E|nr:hypothetical protein DLS60_13265 [Staphylococcus pseudintermedius]RYR80841.1 hypothetical protein DLS63_13525 [Staphylococcus pseudintermedius]RYR89054.1 hypothetical protein DLS56_13310 [Staphylococcus pseudintermedius]RYS26286.1 hypothetical protein DLS45_13555 [Staphylococcus pseudintermedius]RYS32781.1 hypothetical protein DLS39_13310 [Staphylococcus pseudintermedius]